VTAAEVEVLAMAAVAAAAVVVVVVMGVEAVEDMVVVGMVDLGVGTGGTIVAAVSIKL
jgi:predicted TIM-barrel enzyme